MLRDSKTEPGARAGTVVCELAEWDLGYATDDTEALGTSCCSLKLRPDGSPPFFVAPFCDLSA